MSRLFKKSIMAFLLSMVLSPVFAHTGPHNEVYHLHGAVNYFLIVLIIAMLTGAATYYLYKK